MKSLLQNMSWEEAAAAIRTSKGVVIVPCGSVEQHGRHLPIGTDSYVAIALAEDASEHTGTLVAPPLWYGWSPHHMVLPGTVTVRPEVLSELLYDVIESLSKHGLDKIIVINGHRIVNIAWMQIAAQKAQEKLGVTVKIFDPAYMSKEITQILGFGPVGHAEEIETSDMLHIHPDLVHLDRAEDNPRTTPPLQSSDPGYQLDTLCYVPGTTESAKRDADLSGGVSGEPTKASADKGKIYHEHLLNNLLSVIEHLRAL